MVRHWLYGSGKVGGRIRCCLRLLSSARRACCRGVSLRRSPRPIRQVLKPVTGLHLNAIVGHLSNPLPEVPVTDQLGQPHPGIDLLRRGVMRVSSGSTTYPGLHTRLSRTQPRMPGRGRASGTGRRNVIAISDLPRRTHSPRAASCRNACRMCSSNSVQQGLRTPSLSQLRSTFTSGTPPALKPRWKARAS